MIVKVLTLGEEKQQDRKQLHYLNIFYHKVKMKDSWEIIFKTTNWLFREQKETQTNT